MSTTTPGERGTDADRPVAVVTGGGGGIGAAIAEELGRDGWFVVTVDPLVSLDGSEQLPAPEETTAGRIVAAGGAARASGTSVTDADAVRALFAGLVEEFGHLDGVINVAGISRPTGFAKGSDDDWSRVLSVHLDGYLNVLRAALPIMAAAGRGRIVGVTSGSGWRQADAGAYACAKRAVAALTWALGRQAPAGVAVNAMSPIAVTRMVTAALGARASTSSSASTVTPATGGLSLGSMPSPEELGPFGAHLVSESLEWCSGRIFFAGGSEVALLDPPRLLEVVRTDGVTAPMARVLDAVASRAWAPAEANQSTSGATNPRFGAIFDDAEPDADADAEPEHRPSQAIESCLVVSDRDALADAVTAALDARGVRTRRAELGGDTSFAAAADALASAEAEGPIDAVVVAVGGSLPSVEGSEPWERTLAEHEGLVAQIHADAAWARAVADRSRAASRSMRLVTLTDAVTAGGRSRAQSSAQLSRAARGVTDDRVVAFAVSVETSAADDLVPTGELAAHLVCDPEATSLSGAELVVGAGWFGLRSHPHPSGSVTFGGPEVPTWLDDALRRMIGEEGT
jgi:NAD(P)-dependent dehydrogenase (short-subunit alcohol dehydrogenase family)